MRSFEYGDWQNLITGMLMLCAMIAIVACIFAYNMGYSRGYYLGQIDAINGSIHWQLEKQADGSMQWSECDGVCKR